MMFHLKIAFALCLTATPLLVSVTPKRRYKEVPPSAAQEVISLPLAAITGVARGFTWPVRDLAYLAIYLAQTPQRFLDAALIKNSGISHFVNSSDARKLLYKTSYIAGLAAIFGGVPYLWFKNDKKNLWRCYATLAFLAAFIAYAVDDSFYNELAT